VGEIASRQVRGRPGSLQRLAQQGAHSVVFPGGLSEAPSPSQV